MLRNLVGVHMQSGDAARLLGACDRLRLIGGVSRAAVGAAEMRETAGQVALCIFLLKWEQRRNEAKQLLLKLRRDADEFSAGDDRPDPLERQRLDDLLAQPWFNE